MRCWLLDDVFALRIPHTHVNRPYLVAVATVGEAYVHHLGILLRLFHACAHGLLVALRLDDGEFLATIFQHVVGFLRMAVLRQCRNMAGRNFVSALLGEYLAFRHLLPANAIQQGVDFLSSGRTLVHISYSNISRNMACFSASHSFEIFSQFSCRQSTLDLRESRVATIFCCSLIEG